jgi:hypothetical protein
MKRIVKHVGGMKSEYYFDYAKARPNRFAHRWGRQSGLVVLVDAEMAKIFKTPETVNRALHALTEAIPSRGHRAA